MEIILICWFLLALATARTQEAEDLHIHAQGLVGEEIMETILESCYKTENPSNPTVIVGNFNKFIGKGSIIRIDNTLDLQHYELSPSRRLKAANVVLMANPTQKFKSDLKLLKVTQLWNHKVPFFIVGNHTAPCGNSKYLLTTMWRMGVLNAVYICVTSIDNTSVLYTLNPITDYAPHPWKRIEESNSNLYYQNFDANISCIHLTYDKTKILNGYTVTAVSWDEPNAGKELGRNYFEQEAENPLQNFRALRALFIALNATGRFEFAIGRSSMMKRYEQGAADIMLVPFTLDSFRGRPALFPHIKGDVIAVVKLGAEVSTLEKIRRLWSTSVLITASVAVVILFLVLITMNRNFGLALLDITRLLTYVDIQTDTNYQSFRIYFTTMLIFMVISNGVFQGKIAAFLTTRERENPIKSISELIESGYEMYTRYGTSDFAGRNCKRKCKFKEVSMNECIQFVLNGTSNVCAMVKEDYEARFIHLPLDYVEESFRTELEQFKCRLNWPLHNRMNDMMMQLIESGLINFWNSQRTSSSKARRQAMEAEWASAQYRPVQLFKIAFAFHLLAAGLSLSTIVFLLELLWARLCNC